MNSRGYKSSTGRAYNNGGGRIIVQNMAAINSRSSQVGKNKAHAMEKQLVGRKAAKSSEANTPAIMDTAKNN